MQQATLTVFTDTAFKKRLTKMDFDATFIPADGDTPWQVVVFNKYLIRSLAEESYHIQVIADGQTHKGEADITTKKVDMVVLQAQG